MTDRTLTADASAERTTLPELSRVELRVRGEGTTAAEAHRDARDSASTLHESLADVVADEDVRRTGVDVQDSAGTFGPDTDLPYGASEEFSVDCTPETVETVVLRATEAGATVPAVHHSVHESRRRALQDEALAAATERAREKAERVAAAEGVAVGDVRSVTTSEVSSGMGSIVDDALGCCESTALQPDPVSVSAAVEVVYELVD